MSQRTASGGTLGPTSGPVQPLSDEIDLVVAHLVTGPALTPQSSRRLADIIQRFGSFVSRALRISSLDEVRAEHARAFVKAPGVTGAPAVATMHLRRSALRLLFRSARALQLCNHDPTLDLTLPSKYGRRSRPLKDGEIALCRSQAAQTLHETRQPAAWAVAEATATTSELSHVNLSDLDLRNERIWLYGGATTHPRWGSVSPWGLEQLERRVRILRRLGDSETPLVYEGKGSAESRTASCCTAITETLRRAGLTRDPAIGPASVRGWAGAKILADTGSIQEVAHRLGVRSLDRAARLVGHNWDDTSFLGEDT
jgi:integrase